MKIIDGFPWANRSSGERNVDMVLASGPKKLIDCVSAKRVFSAAGCLALLSSQTSVSPHTGECKHLTTGSDYLLFTVTITIVTSLSYPAREITARLCARTGAIRRPV